jgi:hypothetical protein
MAELMLEQALVLVDQCPGFVPKFLLELAVFH